MIELQLSYLILCALVGWAGSERSFGFIGWFLLALFFSPIIAFIVWLFTGGRNGMG